MNLDQIAKAVALANPGSLHNAAIENGVSGGSGGARVSVGPRNLYDGVVQSRRNAKSTRKK